MIKMTNEGKIERKSTLGSALGILVLVLAAIAIVAYLLLNPDILKDIVWVVIVAIVVLIIIAVIVYLAMMLLAVPYYAAKGVQYQTDASYDLKDVKPVKESSSENKANETEDVHSQPEPRSESEPVYGNKH
jgi:hypothetical protein